MLIASTSFGTDKHRTHLFKNGMNSAVYSEGFLSVPAERREKGKDLQGIRFGIQSLRVQDYFAMTLGGSYSSSKVSEDRDYFGPTAEAIFFPQSLFSVNVSYTIGEGSITFENPITGKDRERVAYFSNDLGASIMVRIYDQAKLTVGYLKSDSRFKLDGEKTEGTQESVTLGLRGTLL